MRGGWGQSAALAAAVWLSCSGPVLAGNDEDSTVILFSGRDLWRNGVFAYGGFVTAPGGFDDDGFMLKVLLSSGVYRYNAGDLGGDRVIGFEATTQILPGFRIKRFGIEAKIFFGPDFEYHKLWPDDPGNRLQGHDVGLRFAAEFWTEPTPATMIAASLSLSSITTNNTARLAYGWRVCEDVFDDGFYVGPEVQYFGAEGYRHLRLGVHITELKAENYTWSAAVGYARDSDNVAGPYVRLGFNVRQ
jgi:hypothetical protein